MIVVGAMIGAVSEWEELGERNRSTPANEWGMMLEDTREDGREFPATPGSRLGPPKRGGRRASRGFGRSPDRPRLPRSGDPAGSDVAGSQGAGDAVRAARRQNPHVRPPETGAWIR